VLTVEADVANAPLLSPGTVVFALNTDDNLATGDLDGADYVLVADLKDWNGSVQRWNGKAYVNAKKVAGKGAWTFDVRRAMDSLDLDFTPGRPRAGAVFSYANRSAKLLL
jgi:hypothetical protein